MNIVYNLLVAVLVATLIVVVLAVLWWIFPLMHLALTLPMRRAERARLFLDQVDFAIKQGRPVEETLISLSQSRDMSMGVRFHLVVAWLEQGLSLKEIGDHLGHQSPEATRIYAKVDLTGLRAVGDFDLEGLL